MAKHAAAFEQIRKRIAEMGSDSSTARNFQAEALRLAKATEALDVMHSRRNPMDTDAAHFRRVNESANRLAKESREARERINRYLSESTADISKRIDERCGLMETQYAPEIRQAFRSMSPKQRGEAVKKAIESGDGATLASITKCPAILVGIDDTEQQAHLSAYTARHASDLLAEFEQLTEFENLASTAATIAQNAASNYSDPRRLAEIEQDRAASEEAEASFSQAFSAE